MNFPTSPLYGDKGVVEEAVYSTQEIISDYDRIYGVDVSRCFRGIARIHKWKCLDSGLSFFTPNSCAGNADFYRELSRHPWYYMSEKWEYTAAQAFLPDSGRVLEVGCGHGHFLDQCSSRGLQAVGLELTPPQSGLSSARQVEILEESVAKHAESHPETYDAVCSFQVLEHISEPLPFLQDCCKALRRGGKLILCTPNADSFLRHARTLLDMPPHHITGWRLKTFHYLQRIMPLRFAFVLYEPLADYHIDFFIGTYRKQYANLFDIRGAWAKEPLASLSRKIMQAGARKIIRGQSILVMFTKI